MRTLASRLAGIPISIFDEMSALATRTGAVNLGQGFPDVDGPASAMKVVTRSMTAGENQYAPGTGRPVLKEAIAAHQRQHYGIELDPATQVTVTAGATEAIAAAILGLIEPGDEVIMLEPYYDSYVAMLQMVGAVRVPVTLRAPDFRPDLDELRAAVTPRTRAMLINTPHNPTGTVLTPDELTAIAEIAIEHDLLVITDEVYEHLTYDVEHVPLSTLPGMAERTLSLSSIGKSWSLTGWKIGWATGPAELVAATYAAKQWLTFTSGGPLQTAAAHLLTDQAQWPMQLAASLEANRDLLCNGMEALGMPTRRPQGTYFAMSDISTLGWDDARDFCRALPERAGVAGIPVSAFYTDNPDAGRHWVRWAFCKEEHVIREALDRLSRADLRA